MKLNQLLILGGTAWAKTLPRTKVIDQVFVMDCTGSMGSYIQTAKDKIVDLAEKVSLDFPTHDLRLGFIGYRDIHDWGDAKQQYIEIPFSMDYNQFKLDLVAKAAASGGGDHPEDVYTGLEAASRLKWDGDYRFLTLLSDAPHNKKEGRKSYADFKPVLDSMVEGAKSRDAPFVFTFYKIGSGSGDLGDKLKSMMPSGMVYEEKIMEEASYRSRSPYMTHMPESMDIGYDSYSPEILPEFSLDYSPVISARSRGGSSRGGSSKKMMKKPDTGSYMDSVYKTMSKYIREKETSDEAIE